MYRAGKIPARNRRECSYSLVVQCIIGNFKDNIFKYIISVLNSQMNAAKRQIVPLAQIRLADVTSGLIDTLLTSHYGSRDRTVISP